MSELSKGQRESSSSPSGKGKQAGTSYPIKEKQQATSYSIKEKQQATSSSGREKQQAISSSGKGKQRAETMSDISRLRHDPIEDSPKLSSVQRMAFVERLKENIMGSTGPIKYGSNILSERTKIHYQEKKKTYLEFISDINDGRESETPSQPPLVPWTRWSFNEEMLTQFILHRTFTSMGRVYGTNNKMQLSTIVQEVRELIFIGKKKGEKIIITDEASKRLHAFIYKLAELGHINRKGKDQAIFGMSELTIIIEKTMADIAFSGNINFEYQVILYLLIIMYTRVRPSSLSQDSKVSNAPYIQWKHVTIFKNGDRDARGYKITLLLTIPHLKGRGKYFTEARRTFQKTFTSSIVEGADYNPSLDLVLFICALAFRRGVADYDNFNDWYLSPESKLRLRESHLEFPIFIHSAFDETDEPQIPWTSGSAEKVTSQKIQAAGLNVHGTLYSFRRNFARIINDNLSTTTAATLMGHTPNSLTLKKCYAGRFEHMDMTRLVAVGEAAQGVTLNPLISPHLFHVKDITKYYLTDAEIVTGIDNNQGVQDIYIEREALRTGFNKKYGQQKQSLWGEEDLKQLLNLNDRYKRRRRVLNTRLTREKLLRLANLLPNCMVIDPVTREMVLNEDVIDLPTRELVSSLSLEEEGEILTNNNEDDEEEYEESREQQVIDEEEELEYEEDQAADFAMNSQERIPNDDDVIGEVIQGYHQDACCVEINRLIGMTHRVRGKSTCIWCDNENESTSREYHGHRTLMMHLFESQKSSNTWPGKNGNQGIHCNTEAWVREQMLRLRPTNGDHYYNCHIPTCNFRTTVKSTIKAHLRKKHAPHFVNDLTPEECWDRIRNYFLLYHNYTITDEDINHTEQIKATSIARSTKWEKGTHKRKRQSSVDTENTENTEETEYTSELEEGEHHGPMTRSRSKR